MMDKAMVVARIREFAQRTLAQPDDLTTHDVKRLLPCSSSYTALGWMRAFAATHADEYELLRLPDGKGHNVWVLRARAKSPDLTYPPD